MSVKKAAYFKILGISPTTDSSVIKKAYRKKAFQYHPDRNKLASAHEKFIQLTEAYESLMDPPKAKVSSRFASQKTAEEVLAERMRAARERYQQARKKEEKEEVEYFQMLTTGIKGLLFKILSVVALLLAMLWLVDYHVLDHEIYSFRGEPTNVYGDYISYYIKGAEYSFPKSKLSGGYHLEADVHFSSLFGDLLNVQKLVVQNGVRLKEVVAPSFSFAQAYPFFIAFFLLPFITFVFRRSSVAFTASYLFCISFVAFMLLFRVVSLLV
ncbi:MAG: J domain-containing protein [Crocinitomicaceae bacterium]